MIISDIFLLKNRITGGYVVHIRKFNIKQKSRIFELISYFEGRLGMLPSYGTSSPAYVATFPTKEQAKYFKTLLELESEEN